MSETPLASVFSGGRYVGAILHRGPEGFEAVADNGASHGCYPSPLFCNSVRCTTALVAETDHNAGQLIRLAFTGWGGKQKCGVDCLFQAASCQNISPQIGRNYLLVYDSPVLPDIRPVGG
jgi:hypothetical protein